MTDAAPTLAPRADARRVPGKPAAAPVLREVAEMWHFARGVGIAQQLKALHNPRLACSLAAAALDWGVIALAMAATVAYGWAAVPLSLLLIGNLVLPLKSGPT
jgi:hypothetical protein